ncbi:MULTISPECIES: DUF6879 family protein [unclassified Kribbella]|uniref:DUF6879 family protein n=1 Tax=unclassified Kribbella TaxID=2644121 RepID=UPI003015DE90
MTAEPLAFQLFRSAQRSALHLETRDLYEPNDADWNEWKAGNHFDPAVRWQTFHNLVRDTTGRGVEIRRARIVSEPISEYVQFEYDVTEPHNIAAGEQVRWLPRQRTAGLLVPPNDFWLFDEQVVLWNFCDGNGTWVGEERTGDPDLAKLCLAAFDAVWDRAIPHKEYQPS